MQAVRLQETDLRLECAVGVIAGAGVWAVLQNGLTFANAPVAIRNIVIGVIVVVCVLMDIVRSNGTFKIKK